MGFFLNVLHVYNVTEADGILLGISSTRVYEKTPSNNRIMYTITPECIRLTAHSGGNVNLISRKCGYLLDLLS